MDKSVSNTDVSYQVLNDEKDYEKSKKSFCSELRTDTWNNFRIVSIPSYFTNFTWRIMNLYGIAASNNAGTLIWTTALEIATIVFVVCACVDMIRTNIEARFQSNDHFPTKPLLRKTKTNKNVNGDENWYIGSVKLGFKFFCGVICWTIGWAIFNTYYQDPYRGTDLALRSLGAAIGEYIGLFFACLII